MAAFTADSINILNGQDVAEITSAEPINTIQKGDFLVINGFPPVEILQAYKNGQGERFIELLKPWPHTSQANQPAIVIPTTVDYREAVEALRAANTLVSDNKKAMGEWQTNMGTVTFKDKDGNDVVVKTLRQIEADNQAQMNAYHPYPWALRKGECKARRAANDRTFAASGYVYKGKVYTASEYEKIAEGLFTDETAPNILREGRKGGAGDSKTDYPVLHIAGVLTRLEYLSVADNSSCVIIKLPEAEDGTRTYDSATGEPVTHATPALAFASETTTNKVVTNRADMRGYELFLREITPEDPSVYRFGLIQSLAPDINGVPTSPNTTRPDSYFAWFDGDTTSRGNDVDWYAATDDERKVIGSDYDNNIIFDDETGKWHQWCVRGCSFAGAGNGDWLNVESQGTVGCRFDLNSSTLVKIQGPSDNDDNIAYADHTSRLENPYPNIGLFTARNDSNGAVNGESYLLVCGTVNRLNKGAYHPSFNPLGAAKTAIAGEGHLLWYHSSNDKLIDRASCFKKWDNVWGYSGGSISVGIPTDNTQQGVGRTDLRFYDAIYASGQGGVCRDMRYSAWGLTDEDFSEQDLKIKEGEYRGREVLSITKFYAGNVGGNTAGGGWQLRNYDGTGVNASGVQIALNSNNPSFAESLKHGKMFVVTDGVNSLVLKVTGVLIANVYSLSVLNEVGSFPIISNASGLDSSSLSILIDVKHNKSVAGEFTHTEVIGDPADILLCDDLKDGWVGSWNQEIPNNQSTKVLWNRPLKEIPPVGSVSITENNGAFWTSGTVSSWFGDTDTNSSSSLVLNKGRIIVACYKTKAKMTTLKANGVVHGAYKGVGSVFYTSYFDEEFGALLGYSLTGKVLTQGGGALAIGTAEMQSKQLNKVGRIAGSSTGSIYSNNTHTPLSLAPPANSNSPAFKALNYNAVENQQGFINYAYAQLSYDATAGDWGDDGKIHPVDSQTTMPDENGHTVLVGTARCIEPIGWIKNEK
ncbi:hypothetical protein CWC02_08400 [Pseudoalteromonas sp. S2721]|uniref:hypothetical protein n=1 Tax=Pseudoalteromonas sp. S2721 TaxID=579526 RepID=UPI00110AFBC0|nr:hypothetical protein [Pseudoalteromonas sp. S2721]TMP19078.1 hypothetical protein CWC02_08400 [Pseudoalteromonas sp. S2721]